MELEEKFNYLKYFFNCYYNQSYDDSLEDRFTDFIELESETFHSRLKNEILELEKVL